MARLIAPKLGEALGQTVIVENKPGAGGQIGAAAVAKAAPDGYTLMLDASSFAVNPSLYPKLPYDTEKAFRADRRDRAVSQRAAGQRPVPGEERGRADCRGQGQEGRGLVCLLRQRLGAAPGRRAVRVGRQGRDGARALQGRRPGAERRDRRAGAGVLWQPGLHAAAHPERQAARAGRDLGQALAHPAGRAHAGRSRRAGRRGLRVERGAGARRHARGR